MRTIYLDYNATTPLDPGVREAMLPYLDKVWGNPSSIHHIGREARALLDDARDRAARVWRCKPSEVIFTSGGTESNNLAIFGTARALRPKGRHLITSKVEHHAVLHCFDYLAKKEGFEVTYLPVDSQGRVNPVDLKKAIRPDTTFVSVMAANNEIGTVQPVAELGAICRERGIIFHTDAVQWFGKLTATDIHGFNANLVSLCAHKFHGPKGSGALFIESPFQPDPILFGGGHENERRAGTENMPAIIGLVAAMERFLATTAFPLERMLSLKQRLIKASEDWIGVVLRGSGEEALPNTVSFTVPGTDSIALLAGLDMEGVCASSGSACSAGSLEPSHVILALGVDRAEANSLVRFSFGRETTDADLDHLLDVFPMIVKRVRRN